MKPQWERMYRPHHLGNGQSLVWWQATGEGGRTVARVFELDGWTHAAVIRTPKGGQVFLSLFNTSLELAFSETEFTMRSVGWEWREKAEWSRA